MSKKLGIPAALVLLLLLISYCGEPFKPCLTSYTERGWVRQVWAGEYCGSGCTYSITLEREAPRGELITIRVKNSGAPQVWIGDRVSLTLQMLSDRYTGGCVDTAEGVKLISVRRQ